MYLFVFSLMVLEANLRSRICGPSNEDEEEPDWFGDQGWFV